MIDPTGITSGFAAVEAIFKITGHEGKKELKEKLERAQRYIVETRMEQLSLMEKTSNLERQLAEFQDWESKSKDYQLHSIRSGSILVARKQDLTAEDPGSVTYFCPNCFEDRKLYPVQRTFNPERGRRRGVPNHLYRCQKCKLQVDAEK